jgi:hypothetical protein
MALLNIVILIISEIESKLRSCRRIRFPATHKTLHVGCFQMVITIVVVTKNVCMSRCWKHDQAVYGIRKRASPRFMLLRP